MLNIKFCYVIKYLRDYILLTAIYHENTLNTLFTFFAFIISTLVFVIKTTVISSFVANSDNALLIFRGRRRACIIATN